MEILTSLYTVQIISTIPYSSVSISSPKGILSCSIQCQSGCVAFTYNKDTSNCELVSEFYTGTPPISPTAFYMKNINCPLLDEYKYITSGTTKACVKFYLLNNKNWPIAQSFCQTNGANLIQFPTKQKSDMIIQYLTDRPGLDVQWWIGLRDRNQNHVYQWMNDDVIDNRDSRWQLAEPSFGSFGVVDDCGVLRQGEFWDYNCLNPALNFMCEKTM